MCKLSIYPAIEYAGGRRIKFYYTVMVPIDYLYLHLKPVLFGITILIDDSY